MNSKSNSELSLQELLLRHATDEAAMELRLSAERAEMDRRHAHQRLQFRTQMTDSIIRHFGYVAPLCYTQKRSLDAPFPLQDSKRPRYETSPRNVRDTPVSFKITDISNNPRINYSYPTASFPVPVSVSSSSNHTRTINSSLDVIGNRIKVQQNDGLKQLKRLKNRAGNPYKLINPKVLNTNEKKVEKKEEKENVEKKEEKKEEQKVRKEENREGSNESRREEKKAEKKEENKEENKEEKKEENKEEEKEEETEEMKKRKRLKFDDEKKRQENLRFAVDISSSEEE
jgi:hypothetical protein